jgi:hypothetical protein
LEVEKVKKAYQEVSAQLLRHIVDQQWLDDDPQSPELLARQWSLAAEWVAAWLDARRSVTVDDVKDAVAELTPSEATDCLALNATTFLVAAPGRIGNVFILAKAGSHYRLTWSTAQPGKSGGRQGEILAAWRAENARQGGRGPYWAASGSAGPVIPRLGSLPDDVQGRPRFFIDGIYAQGAGGTVGAQISLWVWDGITAKPQIVRDYWFMVDQAVATRMEGDLLKVQQKKSFRTFFSRGQCEERQTDWIFRVGPKGIEDLGERSAVPELDAVDELFYRVIHGLSAADVAAPAAIKAAEKMVQTARAGSSVDQWKKFPTLGMMGAWGTERGKNDEVLCLGLDDIGTNLFTLKPAGKRLFVADVKGTNQPCEQTPR